MCGVSHLPLCCVSTYHCLGTNSEGGNASMSREGKRGGEAKRDRDSSYSQLRPIKHTKKANSQGGVSVPAQNQSDHTDY